MTSINDLYCGRHVILNLQEYAGAALYDWENVETSGGKVGREKHLMWNRGKESATLLAVRSVCEAYGPDGNPQAGAPVEFSESLNCSGDKSRLKSIQRKPFQYSF